MLPVRGLCRHSNSAAASSMGLASSTHRPAAITAATLAVMGIPALRALSRAWVGRARLVAAHAAAPAATPYGNPLPPTLHRVLHTADASLRGHGRTIVVGDVVSAAKGCNMTCRTVALAHTQPSRSALCRMYLSIACHTVTQLRHLHCSTHAWMSCGSC
jgi:hypothetical protein